MKSCLSRGFNIRAFAYKALPITFTINRFQMNKIFVVLLFAIAVAACNQSNDYKKITNNPDLYAYTVHELNQVVMGNNFSPIVASRNYAYAAIAGYEVVAAGNPTAYQSLAGQLKGLAQMPKPKILRILIFRMQHW